MPSSEIAESKNGERASNVTPEQVQTHPDLTLVGQVPDNAAAARYTDQAAGELRGIPNYYKHAEGLKMAMEFTPEPTIDAEGHITSVNTPFTRMTLERNGNDLVPKSVPVRNTFDWKNGELVGCTVHDSDGTYSYSKSAGWGEDDDDAGASRLEAIDMKVANDGTVSVTEKNWLLHWPEDVVRHNSSQFHPNGVTVWNNDLGEGKRTSGLKFPNGSYLQFDTYASGKTEAGTTRGKYADWATSVSPQEWSEMQQGNLGRMYPDAFSFKSPELEGDQDVKSRAAQRIASFNMRELAWQDPQKAQQLLNDSHSGLARAFSGEGPIDSPSKLMERLTDPSSNFNLWFLREHNGNVVAAIKSENQDSGRGKIEIPESLRSTRFQESTPGKPWIAEEFRGTGIGRALNNVEVSAEAPRGHFGATDGPLADISKSGGKLGALFVLGAIGLDALNSRAKANYYEQRTRADFSDK